MCARAAEPTDSPKNQGRDQGPSLTAATVASSHDVTTPTREAPMRTLTVDVAIHRISWVSVST